MIIDPKSPVPIYLQIALQLRQQIAAGAYRPGESLPSLRRLAQEIQVNPNTIQKAYDELAREGTVESRRGAGLFVVDRPDTADMSQAEQEFVRGLNEATGRTLRAGVSPARIRALFRDVLRAQVEAALRSTP